MVWAFVDFLLVATLSTCIYIRYANTSKKGGFCDNYELILFTFIIINYCKMLYICGTKISWFNKNYILAQKYFFIHDIHGSTIKENLGPVVQSIVSLTSLLSGQLC